jgi:N-formylglutamate amidohydrolase
VHEPLPGPTIHPSRGGLPVLLSVPHAGRDYPQWLLDMARGGRKSLQALEDPLVDRLVWRAMSHGLGAVIARSPRALVDCNRAEDEIDPAIIREASPGRRTSARARGGLGIVPSRTAAHGHLWRHAIGSAELERRLCQVHRPFHSAIETVLDELIDRFGCALLLDCHSMPPPAGCDASVVFGDRCGQSAAPWVISHACRIAEQAGFVAAANDPFAGGHVLERHAAPERGIYALQIEIDRRCYLTPAGEPGEGFDQMALLIESVALELGQTVLEHQLPQAAE